VTVALLLGVNACGGESLSVERENLVLGRVPTWSEFRDEARRTIPDGATYYVFEHDIFVPTEPELRLLFEQKYHSIVKKSTVRVKTDGSDDLWPAGNITWCVSSQFGPEMERAKADFAIAAAQWEAVTNKQFEFLDAANGQTCAGSNAQVEVRPCTTLGCTVGCFPSTCPTGYPAGVWINYNEGLAKNAAYTWLGMWTHELGHVLGLMHEHVNRSCSTETGPARIVNSYDRDSAMHYPDGNFAGGVNLNGCGSLSNGQLTNTDRDGASALYGASPSPYLKILPTEWIRPAVSLIIL
jgi:hypothetical protein